MLDDAEALPAVAQALAAVLAGNYVYSDIGREAADKLAELAAAHDGDPSPDDAAELLTQWAQAATDDRHLRVRFHPDGAPAADVAKAAFLAAFRGRAEQDNYGIARTEILADGVGLIEFTNFFDATVAGAAVVAAMAKLSDCAALVIDVRHNGGGEPGTVALVCSYLFDGDPERTHLNDLITADGVQQWWTLPWVPGRRLSRDSPVYVLTSSRTFSAAEELAYDLQALGRAVIVGERTRGGAHPVEQFRLTDHYTAMIPNGRARNPVTGGNWQGTGVVPDLPSAAEDALAVALAHLRER